MGIRRKRELSMRKVREIMRLGLKCHLGYREIARSCFISHSTVSGYLSQAKVMGLTYEGVEKMDDEELKGVLKAESSQKQKAAYPQPDWQWVHQELKKKGVTLQLLWEEYKAVHPQGYQSSQFYEHYHRWKKKLSVSLRQTHKAGEKMFVDYAGQTIAVHDPHTGKVREAEIFVVVLGASNYTFAEASWDQSLPNWIASHVHAFEYFGGVAKVVVPDNLKSGVSKACWYEPDINPTYHDLAVHYGTVIMPSRVRKPKDKSKVEVGVQVVERWVLASLRNRTFFSLLELNQAISHLLLKLNQRPFKKLNGSRLSLFETVERDQLLPLPSCRYELAEWKKARVNIDYHIELKNHYYSVPYRLVQEEVEVRYTSATIEIFHHGKRVASHKRDDRPGCHATQKEHMPKSHQHYLEWSPSRIIRWAGTVGEATAKVVATILNSRRHPEQGYRSCLGILRLGKHYSHERLEAACSRVLVVGGFTYKSIRSILEKGLERQPLPQQKMQPLIAHENIRGRDYYGHLFHGEFSQEEERTC